MLGRQERMRDMHIPAERREKAIEALGRLVEVAESIAKFREVEKELSQVKEDDPDKSFKQIEAGLRITEFAPGYGPAPVEAVIDGIVFEKLMKDAERGGYATNEYRRAVLEETMDKRR